MPAATPNREYFPLLDALRGPAALLVFLEHWRNLFFADYDRLENPGILMKLFYLFSGAGHEAVLVFFVLSGCVIAHVIRSMHDSDRWSWTSYLSARLTRLWVVLIPALLLTAFWDRLGLHFQGRIYQGEGFGNILNSPVEESLSPLVFIGNLFFLQRIALPTFGSNGPLWSIAYEFVYYLAYPALILCFFTFGLRWWVRLSMLGFAITVLAFAGSPILAAFPIWLAGVGAYWLFRKFPFSARWSLPGFALGTLLVVGCIAGSRSGYRIPVVDWKWLLASATAFAIYCGMSAGPSQQLSQLLKPLQALSAISYSLYLFHMPVLVFVASRLFVDQDSRWHPGGRELVFGLLIAAGVFLYSVLMWYGTEHQTGRVRRWMRRKTEG